MKKFHDGVKQKKEGVAEVCHGFDSNHSGKTPSRWKTGGFLRASTLHTFCFVSHLVLLHFLGSAVSDVPQKALLPTSWTCSGWVQLLSRERRRTTEVRRQGLQVQPTRGRLNAADELAENTMCFHSMSRLLPLPRSALLRNHTGLCVQRCWRGLRFQSPPLMWPL